MQATDWEKAMSMTTQEVRAFLKTLPEEEAQEIRVARLRAARRAYRERHLEQEKHRQADWYKRKIADLRKHPRKLAAHRAADAERKRQQRAAKRED